MSAASPHQSHPLRAVPPCAARPHLAATRRQLRRSRRRQRSGTAGPATRTRTRLRRGERHSAWSAAGRTWRARPTRFAPKCGAKSGLASVAAPTRARRMQAATAAARSCVAAVGGAAARLVAEVAHRGAPLLDESASEPQQKTAAMAMAKDCVVAALPYSVSAASERCRPTSRVAPSLRSAAPRQRKLKRRVSRGTAGASLRRCAAVRRHSRSLSRGRSGRVKAADALRIAAAVAVVTEVAPRRVHSRRDIVTPPKRPRSCAPF